MEVLHVTRGQPNACVATPVSNNQIPQAAHLYERCGTIQLIDADRHVRACTAPQLRTTGEPTNITNPVKKSEAKYGRLNLFEQQNTYLGPSVLRDYSVPARGLPLREPDHYLGKGEGKTLRARVAMKDYIKQHPINRDPRLEKGTGSLRLSFESLPGPNTMFKRLYDLGSLDFVSVHCGGTTNAIRWARPVGRGTVMWGDRPTEVELGRWLPIFVGGIREFGEPYRFLAIRGCEGLIEEAGVRLADMAKELVHPFKAALDTREPTTVAVALELMNRILEVAPMVAQTWIYALPQWAQVLNVFRMRRLTVDMGYNRHVVANIKALVLQLFDHLELNGGVEATAYIRRFATGHDPAVSPASLQRLASRASAHKLWDGKPFTLL